LLEIKLTFFLKHFTVIFSGSYFLKRKAPL